MTKARLIPVLLFVTLALAAIAPIRSYDFFWHLTTGRWIVEHRALPLTDPLAVGSDREPWINGSWLVQVVAYGLEAVVGLAGMSVVRGIAAGLLFTLVYWLAARDAKPHVALALAVLAFAGAMPLLDVRPSSVAALLVVAAIASRKTIAHALLAAIWINIHPSALLAPVIAAFTTRRVAPVVASALALLVNPYGYKAITAPIALVAYVSGGTFVNAEWLPSSPAVFPLLYIALAVGVLAFLTAEDRRQHWWRAALFVMFAYLAIRHARHQSLFFAAFPLLVAPAIRRAEEKLAYALATAFLLFAVVTTDHGVGLMPGRFPVVAAARLKATGLGGNIYNADQFGGYLMWTFHPERRVLTDGRNELYHRLIPEEIAARRDERAWRALLKKYRIDLAVDEYRSRLDVVDSVSGRTSKTPASLAYWPRKQWAMIAYDEAAMVFARRAAFPPEVIERLEIRRVVD